MQRPASAQRPGANRPTVARPASGRARLTNPDGTLMSAAAAKEAIGNRVQVAVRIRPLNRADNDDTQIVVSAENSATVRADDGRGKSKTFNFDNVFHGGQEQLFKAIGVPMLAESFSGFNVCLFAYGQTGSGKTYSLQGDLNGETKSESTNNNNNNGTTGTKSANGASNPATDAFGRILPQSRSFGSKSSNAADKAGSRAGILPRVVAALFQEAQDRMEQEPALTVKITMSMMEIYMEKIRDLLGRRPRLNGGRGSFGEGSLSSTSGSPQEAQQQQQQQPQSLELHEDANKKVFVEGLSTHTVLSYERVLELLECGTNNRQTAETKMNDHSSRSHAIVQFTVCQTYDSTAPDKKDLESMITLVDLAGSERQSKTETSGLQFEEAKKINHSLLMLGRALNSFSDRRNTDGFVSLRESKLTRLLSENFGGNSKTWMLATVSPTSYNFSESMSTLEYANNAKAIVNKATANKMSRQMELREAREALETVTSLLEAEREKNKKLEQETAELRQQLEAARSGGGNHYSNNGRSGANANTATPYSAPFGRGDPDGGNNHTNNYNNSHRATGGERFSGLENSSRKRSALEEAISSTHGGGEGGSQQPPTTVGRAAQQLVSENDMLRRQLHEAEETLKRCRLDKGGKTSGTNNSVILTTGSVGEKPQLASLPPPSYTSKALLSLRSMLQMEAKYLRVPLTVSVTGGSGSEAVVASGSIGSKTLAGALTPLLLVNVLPTDAVGQVKDVVGGVDVSSRYNTRVDFKLQIIGARNLPKLSHMSCKYWFKWKADEVYRTAICEEATTSPEWSYHKSFAWSSVPPSLADYLCSENVLTFEITGY